MPMNICEKLNEIRCELQKMNLRKSGNNNGRKYFELADFLPVATELCKKYKVTPIVSFTQELATLTLYDCEQVAATITFTSPFGSAALKGCHEVQNIGAVETYQRRYLYMTAFEVVEHDALDSSDYGNEPELTLADVLDEAVADCLMTREKADETMAVSKSKKPSEQGMFMTAVLNKLAQLRSGK